MIWSQAQLYLRQFAREANDSTMYPVDQIDRAIMAIGNDFILRTNCSRTASDLTLTPGTNALPTLPTGFLPERLLRAYIANLTTLPATAQNTNPTLTVGDYYGIYEQSLANPLSALPQLVGFETGSAGIVYPTPDATYTLRLLWAAPFVSVTPGSAVGSTDLGLPDDYCQSMLIYGGTSLLQHTSEAHKYASTSWQKYLEFVERIKSLGPGTSGKQVSFRRPPVSTPRRRIFTDGGA